MCKFFISPRCGKHSERILHGSSVWCVSELSRSSTSSRHVYILSTHLSIHFKRRRLHAIPCPALVSIHANVTTPLPELCNALFTSCHFNTIMWTKTVRFSSRTCSVSRWSLVPVHERERVISRGNPLRMYDPTTTQRNVSTYPWLVCIACFSVHTLYCRGLFLHVFIPELESYSFLNLLNLSAVNQQR